MDYNLELNDDYIRGFVDIYNSVLLTNDQTLILKFRDSMCNTVIEAMEYSAHVIRLANIVS